MTDAYQEVLDEAREQLAHVEGELGAVRGELAASVAAEAHLRQELEVCQTEAAVARTELAHVQHAMDEHDELARRRIAELEGQLAEARRLQQGAERERAAVIAALGRRSRRRLGQPAVLEGRSESTGNEQGQR